MHKNKSSPESDTLQAIATLRQRKEGNEHPGLHLSHPLLFLVLVAAAGRCLLFLRPLPIAAEEVCARAHRRRGIAAGHGAAAAQHGSRRREAAGAAIRVVVAVVPTRRRRRKAGAGLVRARRLQRHVLDLKTQEKIHQHELSTNNCIKARDFGEIESSPKPQIPVISNNNY
jgi:hypothetical protein